MLVPYTSAKDRNDDPSIACDLYQQFHICGYETGRLKRIGGKAE